jgi:L-fuconate dehydratase
MRALFTGIETFDLRFSTSLQLYGSDAMHPDPDYSAAYVVLKTDGPHNGHGFTFTIGRGNDVQLEAIRAVAPLVVGKSVAEVVTDMGAFWRHLRSDSQLRWLGPEKGVMQMAVAAIINAVWDVFARYEGKPLWKLLADFSPQQIVDLVDFDYIGDAIGQAEALDLLSEREAGRSEREAHVRERGYPAYTTSPGWLGYNDAEIRSACRAAVEDGWRHVKIKVGRDIDDDARRCAIVREEIGSDVDLMLDANQRWSIDEAIANVARLARFNPVWIEEPTHPDDVLGHVRIAQAVAPIAVACGEHIPNAVVFKQFIRSGAMHVAQIDACRSGGVNDVLATMLMAAKYDIPVCPHAGGVGLCELTQHLSIFDYIAVSGRLDGRVLEFVDRMHEHFVDPAVVHGGRYVVPTKPGFSSQIKAKSLEQHVFKVALSP